MCPRPTSSGWDALAWILIALAASGSALVAQAPDATAPKSSRAILAEAAGTVEVLRSGARTWDFASTKSGKSALYSGDQLHTGPRSRATVHLSDRTVLRLGPESYIEIFPEEPSRTGLGLMRGLLYLFHRDSSTSAPPLLRR